MEEPAITPSPQVTFGHNDDQKKNKDPEIAAAEHFENDDELKKDYMNYDRVDKEVAKYASEVAIDISPEENIRLRKLVDRRVLAIMIFTYFLQALDKGTLSFSSIMGIRSDLHLHGQQFSWLTTCIYIAILVVEYPTNWLIQRLPIAKYLGVSIILWGIVLALHAKAITFTHILVLRTFLGIFEAVCQPSFIYLSTLR